MFLVAGEAFMDVFAQSGTSTRTGTQLEARSGGSPPNVAIALARRAQSVAVPTYRDAVS